jgi:ABC-2 type transport system ATP-binding protein
MPAEYKERINELADVLDIKKEMFKPIKTYSGGMKRKLEIIRSLMHKPKILFLDEPTSGLDPISRRNLWEYIQKVKEEENTTIFLTTHYLEEAERADDVGVINNGKIVEEGSPTYLKKKLVKNYITLTSKESTKLKKELEGEGFEVSGTKELKVKVDDNNHALRILRGIKSPIDELNVHTPTLEEAYFEIIENDQNGARS